LEAAPLAEVQDWLHPYERFWRDRLKGLGDLLAPPSRRWRNCWRACAAARGRTPPRSRATPSADVWTTVRWAPTTRRTRHASPRARKAAPHE
ncbi:hypothetical protein ABZS63_36445, partial [Streptomyces sp. NPDC005568]